MNEEFVEDFTSDGELTPIDIVAALPQLELIKNEMYKEIQDDCCLCQVDLADTFDTAGLEWESDCMQFTLIAL